MTPRSLEVYIKDTDLSPEAKAVLSQANIVTLNQLEQVGVNSLPHNISASCMQEIEDLIAHADSTFTLFETRRHLATDPGKNSTPPELPGSEKDSPAVAEEAPVKDEVSDQDLCAISLNDLNLSGRARNFLLRNGVSNAKDLIQFTAENNLFYFTDISFKTIKEIRAVADNLRSQANGSVLPSQQAQSGKTDAEPVQAKRKRSTKASKANAVAGAPVAVDTVPTEADTTGIKAAKADVSKTDPVEADLASEALRAIPISALPLSSRARKFFQCHNVSNAKDLIQLTSENDLLSYRNIGPITANEILAIAERLHSPAYVRALLSQQDASGTDSVEADAASEALRSISLSALPLSARARKLFQRHNVSNAKDLIQFTSENNLLSYHAIGFITANEILAIAERLHSPEYVRVLLSQQAESDKTDAKPVQTKRATKASKAKAAAGDSTEVGTVPTETVTTGINAAKTDASGTDPVEADPASEALRAIPLAVLPLSSRARKLFQCHNVSNARDLIQFTSENNLLSYRNIGITTIRGIRAVVEQLHSPAYVRALLSRQAKSDAEPVQVKRATKASKTKAAAGNSAAVGTVPTEAGTTGIIASGTDPVEADPASEALRSIPLAALPLSARARKLFRCHNVSNAKELIQFSENDLLSYRNIGITTIKGIRAVVEQLHSPAYVSSLLSRQPEFAIPDAKPVHFEYPAYPEYPEGLTSWADSIDEVLSTMSVASLDLGTRACRALTNAGITNAKELIHFLSCNCDLKSMDNLGDGTERKIIETINNLPADIYIYHFPVRSSASAAVGSTKTEALDRWIHSVDERLCSISLSDLNLSTTALDFLQHNNISNAKDLVHFTPRRNIYLLPNFSPKTYREICGIAKALHRDVISPGPPLMAGVLADAPSTADLIQPMGKGFDYNTISTLRDEFSFHYAMMTEWFGLCRERIRQLLNKRSRRHRDCWRGNILEDHEADIVHRLILSRKYIYKDEDNNVTCYCFNNRKDNFVCIFVYENSIKCFFLHEFPKALQEEIIFSDYHVRII